MGGISIEDCCKAIRRLTRSSEMLVLGGQTKFYPPLQNSK